MRHDKLNHTNYLINRPVEPLRECLEERLAGQLDQVVEDLLGPLVARAVDQRVVEDREGGATGGFSGLHCSYQLVEQLHGVERALGIGINIYNSPFDGSTPAGGTRAGED